MKKEELKNDFISSVSHELRTPLTSIKGWAITLKEDYENKAFLQDGLNIIEKECDRLTEMVTELLDFSRFVTGKITLKKEKVEITALLAQLKMQLAPRAAREKIEFQVLLPETPLYLFTDGDRLKQVFINLLDNAFKFTAGGGQVVLKAETNEQFIYISVEDTGCGIAPEELPRVKEKFYKGKSSQAQSGIGLSLSDEIIRLMQGKLEIQSELGQGTCVTSRCPAGRQFHEKLLLVILLLGLALLGSIYFKQETDFTLRLLPPAGRRRPSRNLGNYGTFAPAGKRYRLAASQTGRDRKFILPKTVYCWAISFGCFLLPGKKSTGPNTSTHKNRLFQLILSSHKAGLKLLLWRTTTLLL